LKCPKCGGTSITSTLMSRIVIRKAVPDDANDSTCSVCGYKGKRCEFGGVFYPVKGTENWTEEQAAAWMEKFRKGEIKMGEAIGVSIGNKKAVSRINIKE